MKKKILLATCALAASMLMTTNGFAACEGGVSPRFVGVGSSAQFNALAYAAAQLLTNSVGSYALISFKGTTITDKRPATPLTDSGLSTWIEWDPTSGANCQFYVYVQTDSGVGNKDFFAYEKFTATNSTVSSEKVFSSIAAAYGTFPTNPSQGNLVGGLADNATPLPTAISTYLNATPESVVNVPSPPGANTYCGNVSTVSKTSQYHCYWNAAGTDIRPEDALYAVTRGLASYNGLKYDATTSTKTVKEGNGELTGLGYGAGAGCTGGTSLVGCGIEDSFLNGSTASAVFNVVTFKLSGTDPISGGTLPLYTTLSVGASPVVVIVGNEDTGTSGLGYTYTDGAGNTNYRFNDINKQVLAQIYSGQTYCTGDMYSPDSYGAANLGAGQPLQVITREPLSGTYNTFEFTGVRTSAGSAGGSFAAQFVLPISNFYSGQEEFNDPNVNPNLGGCAYNTGGYPDANCFNPMYITPPNGSQCNSGTLGGIPVRLRAIGTGEEVKAVIGALNKSGSGSTTVYDPIGYSFWSYGNLDPLCAKVSGTSCIGISTVGTWLGHYLTVDAIDPLFSTEGGEFDNVPNPSGAFNPPVCDLKPGSKCFPIPFTNMYNGKYPLWTLLRTVTFAPVANKVVTPTAVLDMIATEESKSAPAANGGDGLSDFVPFLSSVTGSNGSYTGNLNLWVFRTHFKQSNVNPANGIAPCHGVFTGITLQGGKVGSPTCLVDFGGDEGGSVVTVQKQVDFIGDWTGEEYGAHQ